jgi:hypothetical protein
MRRPAAGRRRHLRRRQALRRRRRPRQPHLRQARCHRRRRRTRRRLASRRACRRARRRRRRRIRVPALRRGAGLGVPPRRPGRRLSPGRLPGGGAGRRLRRAVLPAAGGRLLWPGVLWLRPGPAGPGRPAGAEWGSRTWAAEVRAGSGYRPCSRAGSPSRCRRLPVSFSSSLASWRRAESVVGST